MYFCFPADAVAITWANRVFPSLAWIMPFAISTSLFSNLLISIFKSSRPIYLASQEGQLPLLFNTLNSHSSPFTAVLLLVTLGSLAIILTSLIDLINYIFFTNSLWSILLMIGILRRRYQEPNLSIPYKVKFDFLILFCVKEQILSITVFQIIIKASISRSSEYSVIVKHKNNLVLVLLFIFIG